MLLVIVLCFFVFIRITLSQNDTESFPLSLWIVKNGTEYLYFNDSLPYDEFVSELRTSIEEVYNKTDGFESVQLESIVDPQNVTGIWLYPKSWLGNGIYFNFTLQFTPGFTNYSNATWEPWEPFMNETASTNLKIGSTSLYLSPFKVKHDIPCPDDCFPMAECNKENLTCQCPEGHKDLDPENPGRECRFDECFKPSDNKCGYGSFCIDLNAGYKCNCLPGFEDATWTLHTGRHCKYDYCGDLDLCDENSTCINENRQAKCQCNDGYINTRKRGPVPCMHTHEVNECSLQLTNCSNVATCTDLLDGYSCSCPEPLQDTFVTAERDKNNNLVNLAARNPWLQGRFCGHPHCHLCNFHGDCIHDITKNNVACVCYNGYHGEQCEKADYLLSWVVGLAVAVFIFLVVVVALLCKAIWTKVNKVEKETIELAVIKNEQLQKY